MDNQSPSKDKTTPPKAKKWPTVATIGIFNEGKDYLTLPSCAVDAEIPWARTTNIWPKLTEGRRGVLFLEVGGAVVVIKSSLECAQETFATLLCQRMGIVCPTVRIIQRVSEEYKELLESSTRLVTDPYYTYLVNGAFLNRPQIYVMEAIVNSIPFSELDSDEARKRLDSTALHRIGKIIVFDLLIHNGDRFPFGEVLRTEGNAENILFSKAALTAKVTAIDQVYTYIKNDQLREDYYSKLRDCFQSYDGIMNAIEPTRSFIEHTTGHDIGTEGKQYIFNGIIEGIRTCTTLTQVDLEEMKHSLSLGISPNDDPTGIWQKSYDSIHISQITRIIDVLRDSNLLMQLHYVRIESSKGLGNEVDSILGKNGNDSNIFVFDFDRTLTNGFSNSPNDPIEKRIRGGQITVDALMKLKKHSIPFYVLTARNPRKMVVSQLLSSLRNAQRELGSVILEDVDIATIQPEELSLCGHTLAYAKDYNLYSSGYQKPIAIAHILTQLIPEKNFEQKRKLYFVDDMVMNAHDVASRLGHLLLMLGREDLVQTIELTSYWWDTFSEESSKNPTMNFTRATSNESGYPEYLSSQLLEYGIDEKERSRRNSILDKVYEVRGDNQKEKVKLPGKLKTNSAQQDLAKFLFGGGKKR